ncbi:MAG: hypothetical protein V7739_20765 [Motiliproteus sp.]
MDSKHLLSTPEDGSYMMSVSDIMSGLMFVFIITLAIFIINFQIASKEHEDKVKNLEAILSELEGNNAMRASMLIRVQSMLAQMEVDVTIDEEHGVLRLDEQAVRFDTGSDRLSDQQRQRLMVVGGVLAEILPCYAAIQPDNKHCLPETKGKLDSVFIEGHTDNVPIRGRLAQRFKDNWALSAVRSVYTYRNLVLTSDRLSGMLNVNQQPIFSVSGYGEGRPVPGHEHTKPTNDPENRRIDFRFIMTPPSVTETQAALDGNFQ